MRKRYEIVQAAVLVLFLIAACMINNTIIKGILLFVFAGVLIYSTVTKLMDKKDDRIGNRIFYGVLLLLYIILAACAVYVIVSEIF